MHDQTEFSEALRGLGADAPPEASRGLLSAFGRHVATGRALPRVPGEAVVQLLSAARQLAAAVTADTHGLADLDDRWHRAADQAAADAMLTAPLALHLDALFAVEAVGALRESCPVDTAEIDRVSRDLTAAFMVHDSVLRSHLECLCTLSDADILTNWRRSLPEGMDPVPWWLDGTLESAAAALVSRTDAVTRRISGALGNALSVRPLPVSAGSAKALREAAGFTLAAATAAPAAITSHTWRHPSMPIEAVLWVPAAFDDDADVRMVFRGSRELREELALVGEVVLLEGMPAVVRLERDGDVHRVEASWPAHALAAAIRDDLAMIDGQGRRWAACG